MYSCLEDCLKMMAVIGLESVPIPRTSFKLTFKECTESVSHSLSMEQLQAVNQNDITDENLGSWNLSYGQTAFMWDSDTNWAWYRHFSVMPRRFIQCSNFQILTLRHAASYLPPLMKNMLHDSRLVQFHIRITVMDILNLNQIQILTILLDVYCWPLLLM